MAKQNTETQADGALPATIKKFRQSPEIEGFYRFIYENDLREESLEILQRIIEQRKEDKRSKAAKKK